MIEWMTARVERILAQGEEITELMVSVEHTIQKAVNYNKLTGRVQPGDRLILNTTAGTLQLGTGGVHFVLANLDGMNHTFQAGGHGMKLRYTPMQLKVSYVEEDGPGDGGIYNRPLDLQGKPIFFGELHSMLPPLCACLRYLVRRPLRIVYIMTDHAALPATFSRNLQTLKAGNLLDAVITTGNAFGGDLECVNIYTALQTAVGQAGADVVVVTMGPGITGTGTRYGFSGLEMGFYMDLAQRHRGQCYYLPRVGFGDTRERHRGISHHSITILGDMCHSPLHVVLPTTGRKQMGHFIRQLRKADLLKRHLFSFGAGDYVREAMAAGNLKTQTMGRGIDEEPCFYNTIGAAVKRAMSV